MRERKDIVSVIIPTHNRRERLMNLLADLDRQDLTPATYEVIIIDDGSTDGTREALASLHPRYPLKYCYQECRGPAAARSAGIRLAHGEVILLLDDDIRIGSGHLRSHLEVSRRHADAVIFGPSRLSLALPATPFVCYRRTLERAFEPAEQSGECTLVALIASANLSARRTLLEDVGLYCEDLCIPGAEEAELSWRLHHRGVPIVFCPSLHAEQNDSPVTFGAYCAKNERYAMACVEVLAKCPHVARELSLISSSTRINGPIALWTDPPVLTAKKVVKTLLSQRPGLAFLKTVVGVLERYLPATVIMAPLYRLVIGLHIFRGFRAGLATFQMSSDRIRQLLTESV